MFDRLLSALIALSLAFLVWLYARSRDQEMLDNIPIPVVIGLPPGQADHYELEVAGPSQVPVAFKGPVSRIRELRGLLQRGAVQVQVTLAVPDDHQSESRYRDTVRVDAADIHGPPGVTPSIVEGRNRIPVTLRRIVERRLPVRLDPAPDGRVSQVVLEPATVLVRGPEEILDRLRSLPTQPVALPSVGEESGGSEPEAARPALLVQEIDGRPIHTLPEAVQVRLTWRPQQKLYELTDVPVQFLCPPNFSLRPRFVDERAARISLRVRGPATEEAPVVVAFIDLTARKFEPGLYADEPLRLQLPKDFQLDQEPPRSAAFQLVPAADPALPGRDILQGPKAAAWEDNYARWQ
jgi:hypothetical protein